MLELELVCVMIMFVLRDITVSKQATTSLSCPLLHLAPWRVAECDLHWSPGRLNCGSNVVKALVLYMLPVHGNHSSSNTQLGSSATALCWHITLAQNVAVVALLVSSSIAASNFAAQNRVCLYQNQK